MRHVPTRAKRAAVVVCVCGVAVLFSMIALRQVASAATINRLSTKERVVVLTFDDGPDPVFTPATLEILKQKHVPAMFFVPGTTADRVGRIRHRDYDSRHVVASHGLTHAVMRNLSWSEQVTELQRGEVKLARAMGAPAPYVVSPYVRAPRGEVRRLTLVNIWLHGRVCVGWSSAYDKREHYGIKDQAKRVSAFVDSVQPGDIILMHDGNRHSEQMVKDLPLIIDGLAARGYTFATLDETR